VVLEKMCLILTEILSEGVCFHYCKSTGIDASCNRESLFRWCIPYV